MRKDIRSQILPTVLMLGLGILTGTSTLLAAPQTQPVASAPVPTDNDGATYTIGPDGKLVKTDAKQVPEDPSFVAFDAWMEKYAAAPDAQKVALEKEGVTLSKARRAAMKELIQQNPARALELSIGTQERQNLPSGVKQNLEEILQGRGEFGVISQSVMETVPGEDGKNQQALRSSLRRTLTFDGRVYTAVVYGKREGLLTKIKLPFYGIAIDNVIVIHESPIWVLPAGQKPPAGATPSENGVKCPICKKEAEGGIVGVVGSTLYYFDTERDLEKFRDSLWEAEQIIGPNEHA